MSEKKQQQTTFLFQIKSGRFIGWRMSDDFFTADGRRAGRFIGEKLYWDDGSQIGWVYPVDPRRIGLRNGYGLSSTGNRGITTKSVNLKVPGDLPKCNDSAWSDPEI